MQNKVIINFLSTDEKKALYTAACKDLGISISEVCRRALDNTVALSEKLKTPAPSKKAESVADTIPAIPEAYGAAHARASKLTCNCPKCGGSLNQEALHPHEIYCEDGCGFSCEPHDFDKEAEKFRKAKP